jgi:hypothetical protein
MTSVTQTVARGPLERNGPNGKTAAADVCLITCLRQPMTRSDRVTVELGKMALWFVAGDSSQTQIRCAIARDCTLVCTPIAALVTPFVVFSASPLVRAVP